MSVELTLSLGPTGGKNLEVRQRGEPGRAEVERITLILRPARARASVLEWRVGVSSRGRAWEGAGSRAERVCGPTGLVFADQRREGQTGEVRGALGRAGWGGGQRKRKVPGG